MENRKLLVGAHTSAAGGVHKALIKGKEIGATTIQIFTSNQKRWHGKLIDEEEVKRFEEMQAETGISKIMSHDSYLINLGSPDPELLEKSINAFTLELKRCHQLKLSYLNFHPGIAKTSTEEECLDQIVKSLSSIEELANAGPTRLLIETTAGQGTTVGNKFEHLAYLIERLESKIPIGVCIDTCHIFAAGYDLRTKDAYEHTFAEFDRIVGLQHLYAFHLNDSLRPFASRKDRHASIGQGEIGAEAFSLLMKDPRFQSMPKYLETPNGETMWKEEIAMLNKYAEENSCLNASE